MIWATDDYITLDRFAPALIAARCTAASNGSAIRLYLG
jgi:hypothetical protein